MKHLLLEGSLVALWCLRECLRIISDCILRRRIFFWLFLLIILLSKSCPVFFLMKTKNCWNTQRRNSFLFYFDKKKKKKKNWKLTNVYTWTGDKNTHTHPRTTATTRNPSLPLTIYYRQREEKTAKGIHISPYWQKNKRQSMDGWDRYVNVFKSKIWIKNPEGDKIKTISTAVCSNYHVRCCGTTPRGYLENG